MFSVAILNYDTLVLRGKPNCPGDKPSYFSRAKMEQRGPHRFAVQSAERVSCMSNLRILRQFVGFPNGNEDVGYSFGDIGFRSISHNMDTRENPTAHFQCWKWICLCGNVYLCFILGDDWLVLNPQLFSDRKSQRVPARSTVATSIRHQWDMWCLLWSLQDMVNSLWACARLGYNPGDAFLEARKGSRRAQGHPKEVQDVQEKLQLHFFRCQQ